MIPQNMAKSNSTYSNVRKTFFTLHTGYRSRTFQDTNESE